MQEDQGQLESSLLRFMTTDAPAKKEQLARELLAQPSGHSFITERLRLRSHDTQAAAWEIALHDVRGTVEAEEDWIARTLWWLEEADAAWQASASFCSDAAWEGRKRRRSALLSLQPEQVRNADPATVKGRALHQIYLTSLRFDFRFRQIESFFDGGALRVAQLDPFSQAIYAFALLGQNDPRGMQRIEPIRELAGNDGAVLHVLMHGLWFAYQLPRHAELLLELAEDPQFADKAAPILEYRRAYALRKLGHYEHAVQAIDKGTQFLSPEATDVHMDFVRERSLIVAEQQTAQRVSEQFEAERERSREAIEEQTRLAREQLGEQLSTMHQQVSDNLFKIVEVLGVFVALIALLAGSVSSVAIGNLEWWQRLLMILTTGIVVLGFFWTLRAIVRPRR